MFFCFQVITNQTNHDYLLFQKNIDYLFQLANFRFFYCATFENYERILFFFL